MKKSTLTLLFLICFTHLNAQFSSENVISNIEDWAIFVHSADLDGDGDMDVLAAAQSGDTISWYENLDGLGNFGSQQIISSETDGAYCIYATDIDNDGDMDVISGSSQDNKVAWYENTNGLGTFGPQQIIAQDTECRQVLSVYPADLDGDGDIDVLSANAFGTSKIAWYENIDGFGTFSNQQTINSSTDGERSVIASDLDGDGDLDVISSSYLVDKIVWYQNVNGLGDFSATQVISTNLENPGIINAGDLDGDGDMDILATSHALDMVVWFENMDGQGSFSLEQIISTDVDSPENAYPTDVDNDGDLDVLSTSLSDDKLAWYENIDGLGNFGSQQIISTSTDQPASIFPVDIDGDGNLDVLSASSRDDKIAWFENLSSLSVNENTLLNISFYPNPVENLLTIKSKTDIIKIEIYNNIGQIVLSNSNQNTVDFSNLPSAIYSIKIHDNEYNFEFKKIVKK